jgi:hypothetical protein
MDKEKRDKHLNELFGIETPSNNIIDVTPKEIIVTEQNNSTTHVTSYDISSSSFQNELNSNQKKLQDIYESAKQVLDSNIQNIQDFSNPRHIEVQSKIIDSMTNLVKEMRETTKLKYEGINEQQNTSIENQQNVFVGDSRGLIDMIKKMKDSIL